jgi:adenylosuccinate lyase
MLDRYANPEITKIFSDEHKLNLWQETELAVIEAMLGLGMIRQKNYEIIFMTLKNAPIDLEWWKKRDKEIHHDLNAFIDERVRHLPTELHQYFHKNITSYDTEEPAFARMLREATEVLLPLCGVLKGELIGLAIKYRFTIMNARTHGQEAELQSFGARCLSWAADYDVASQALIRTLENLGYSKLSGAIGKYGSLNPEIEKLTLSALGFKPFPGATQIMPRILYAPVAQALSNLVSVLDKIAGDIRLAARSGRPIMQEPFQKKQKGSSAMPHKKNTIRTEQIEGMARLARGYMIAISENVKTWEERAIEQSSVERVAWPDLFHVTAQALKVMNLVLSDLKVYPDNMLQEIYESRGVYASSEAKEFLKTQGLSHEAAYRIVQLASFNVFEPGTGRLAIRETIPASFGEANNSLKVVSHLKSEKIVSIEDFIPRASLRVSENLDATWGDVDNYNAVLHQLFSDKEIVNKWHKLFSPEYLLKHEKFLYEQMNIVAKQA